MRWGKILDYYKFSEKEIRGIRVIMLVGLVIYFIPDVVNYLSSKQETEQEFHLKYIQVLRQNDINEPVNVYFNNRESEKQKRKRIKLKPFNPNILTQQEWVELGLSEKQATVILNYIKKGGKFKKVEDLSKIFVISPKLYNEIAPFVVLPIDQNLIKSNVFNQPIPNKNSTKLNIDINTDSIEELEQLTGIGKVLATRILKYKNKLGGYIKKAQLLEVYGIDTPRYLGFLEQIYLTEQVKKISINTAKFEELINHPYLNYNQVRAIIQYRNQHGDFSSIDDLKKVYLITEADCKRLAPYLLF